MNIRLEYSQALGQFNQAQATDQTDTAKGYKTVCCFTSSERATRFVYAMTEKYPVLRDGQQQGFPSWDLMKEELLHFLEEDIRLFNEHMAKTFQRRKSLFHKSSN